MCLGLQAIGEVYGAKLKNLDHVFHGMKTPMYLTKNKSCIFEGIPKEFEAGRYHSWVIDNTSDTSEFFITAEDESGEIMGIQHKSHSVFAVQFHPESIMTDFGREMLENFLNQ